MCRIRKTVLEGCNVSVIGQNVDLTYPYHYLGQGATELGDALKDEEFVKSFKEAKFPVVLVGPGILRREDRNTILQQVSLYCICMHCMLAPCLICKDGAASAMQLEITLIQAARL